LPEEGIYSVLQQHRTIGHYAFMKAYFPKDKSKPWAEAAHLFEVSDFSVKRYARMVPSIVN
jgi:hypothetical protein